MIRLLTWYYALVVGGLAFLVKSLGWLGQETLCIVRAKSRDRLFPHRRPIPAIAALFGTLCTAVVLYTLSITLIIPAMILLVHSVSKLRACVKSQTQQNRSEERVLKRNWHYYDGTLYDTAFEPFAKEMRHETIESVPAGTNVIDICCGTGGLAFQLAHKCESVTGIDHAQGMIDFACSKLQRQDLSNISFLHADARFVSDLSDQSYDYATLSMALHEMPREMALEVLKEAARVAKQVLVIDYAVPLPKNIRGLMFSYLEVIAGPNHLKGFLDYNRHNGLDSLLNKANLRAESDTTAMRDCIGLVRTVRSHS